MAHDLFGRELPSAPDNCRRPHRFRDRFDPAQSASRRSSDTPSSFTQMIGFRLAEPHPQFDTVIERQNFQRANLGRRADNAFAHAEADCKILQVPRCRHHHRIGPAVVSERYRRLLWNRTAPKLGQPSCHLWRATTRTGSIMYCSVQSACHTVNKKPAGSKLAARAG